jgi:hypothetical protein
MQQDWNKKETPGTLATPLTTLFPEDFVRSFRMTTLRQLVLQAVRHLRRHLPFIAEKRSALGAGQP